MIIPTTSIICAVKLSNAIVAKGVVNQARHWVMSLEIKLQCEHNPIDRSDNISQADNMRTCNFELAYFMVYFVVPYYI